MAHEVEDEVDWSDGTLDEPRSTPTSISRDSGYISPSPQEDDGLDYLFESREEDQQQVPLGTALPPVSSAPVATRSQRARIGVHLNRRQPSQQDYAHFALYQANQKAYEATFIKHLSTHALHPSQIDRCFQDGADPGSNVKQHLASVTASLIAVTNKVVWNAHCRAVNLLANTGRDSAPFWDVTSFDQDVFTELSFEDPLLVARKLNESWHRLTEKPSMVRYTTKNYPIGYHDSPLEEIDEVLETLFNDEAFGNTLLTGRVVKYPRVKKGKGQGLPVASSRKPANSAHHDNWLTSLLQPEVFSMNTPAPLYPHAITPSAVQPQLVGLKQPQEGLVNQATTRTWSQRLLEDHRRRLPPNPPQMLERAVPGIRAVLAEAVSKGYRPVDPNLEELVIEIENQEQAASAEAQHSQQVPVVRESEETRSEPIRQRKRELDYSAPIRMLNRPIEPSKKKRKVETTVAVPAAAASSARRPLQGVSTCRKTSQSALKNIIPETDKLRAQAEPRVPPASSTLVSLHPSGSKTLEPHQELPPDAYFKPKSTSEQPVWRCGIKHAMGHYYNAGDRKNCPGCFTALTDNMNAKFMDFYLPSRTHYHQPNPTSRWRPSKPFQSIFKRDRRCKSLSHNSIAKEAYWAAIDNGADDLLAFSTATNAVTQHLAPKCKKEPTPPPTPEPEPDLGPHPSGSVTMEHGQDLPLCATFAPHERHEEPAWRCDVNHALGRYYLAGDRRSCPGCGSNKGGAAKQKTMDFFMPLGAFVRQEVDELKWKPRKPYKMGERKNKKIANEKSVFYTHNQTAGRLYWEALGRGLQHDDAIKFAIGETDRSLNEREEEADRKAELREKIGARKAKKSAKSVGNLSSDTSSHALNALRAEQRTSTEASRSGHGSDEEMDDADDEDMDGAPSGSRAEDESSSDHETSSDSERE